MPYYGSKEAIVFPATRLGIILAATSLLAAVPAAAGDYNFDWSGTFQLRFLDFESPVDDDSRTGFFDRYEFVSNKHDEPAVEFGLSALDLDLLAEEGETPKLQLRLRSPTSNLGISGGGLEGGESFLNQRVLLQAQHRGVSIDLDYRRLRTDEFRLFRNGGFGNDQTDADDRFFVRRNRVGGEIRIRPLELLKGERGELGGFLSEIALRGGYRDRMGQRQTRYGFRNQITSALDQEVVDGGAGLVFRPGGLFTLAVDFDHQRFRENARARIPNFSSDPVAFIPDTDRNTGTVRLNTRLGDRLAVHGAFRVSSLQQKGDRTPDQMSSGLGNNELLFYSGNFGANLELMRDVSLNTFFKIDSRHNKIDRDTNLFSRNARSAPFLKRLRKIAAGAELVLRLPRLTRVSFGARRDWVDRDLKNSTIPINTDAAILSDETETYTVYVAARSRPIKGLQLSGKIGYQDSPKTGYIRELENVHYGRLRGSYTFPFPRPVTLSLFGRWKSGENDDFTNASEDRDFKHKRFSWGATLSASPSDGATLFGSVFQHDDAQDFDLRYGSTEEPRDYRVNDITMTVGGRFQISEQTDAGFSHSFTRSKWRFEPASGAADAIEGLSRIRSDLHRSEFEIGHWLREGLRVSAGYHFDKYRDRSSVSTSPDDFSRSTRRHTALFSVTLNNDFIR